MKQNLCIKCGKETENTDKYELLTELELEDGSILEEGNISGPFCEDCEDELYEEDIIDILDVRN